MNLRALFTFAVWAGIGYAAIVGLNKFYEESRVIAGAGDAEAPPAAVHKASPVDLPNSN